MIQLPFPPHLAAFRRCFSSKRGFWESLWVTLITDIILNNYPESQSSFFNLKCLLAYFMSNNGCLNYWSPVKESFVKSTKETDFSYLLCDFGRSPCGSDGKASPCNAGDPGSIPGLGRSSEKEIATHSSTLAWKIPWTEEPGSLQSMGS